MAWHLLLLLYHTAHIAASNGTNDHLVGYHSGSNERNTWDIVRSCLATLFICVYTCLHVDISTTKLSVWQRTQRAAKWMLVTALAPEVTLAKALAQFIDSRLLSQEMHKLGHTEWSMVQSFYVVMGGFCVDISGDNVEGDRRRQQQLGALGFFKYLRQSKNEVLHISRDDIEDKSKTDAFAKILACIQTIWFVAQVIGRGVQGLAVAELELATTAFVTCTVMTYILWWYKPKDIQTTTVVECRHLYDQWDCMKRPDLSPRAENLYGMFVEITRTFTIPTDSSFTLSASILFASFAGTIFSAIHIIAWNFFFPSKVEQILWRCSSVIATASMLGFTTITMLLLPISWRSKKILRWFAFCRRDVCVLYITARIVLIIQMFTCLRLMSTSAYQRVSWVQAFPHI